MCIFLPSPPLFKIGTNWFFLLSILSNTIGHKNKGTCQSKKQLRQVSSRHWYDEGWWTCSHAEARLGDVRRRVSHRRDQKRHVANWQKKTSRRDVVHWRAHVKGFRPIGRGARIDWLPFYNIPWNPLSVLREQQGRRHYSRHPHSKKVSAPVSSDDLSKFRGVSCNFCRLVLSRPDAFDACLAELGPQFGRCSVHSHRPPPPQPLQSH